ncbi:vacuolar membrane protein [Kockovaella imperatae]|uniref:Vacuolar membrane protein n=1 Tax=Kockovaella imperatae TaxID=4999 RepID=A0A1Y1UIG4_9TREE|nr:vacuolar membrane protein [Kockovaella imperatae]ORX37840.1 vacuolar membrane protein [Kockovaella imperatae]
MTSSEMFRAEDPPRRGQGICAIRGSCGKTSILGAELPCPDDGDATEVDHDLADLMRSVCGPSYSVRTHACCTRDQVETLGDRLKQAAPLIASCPACHNNFRSFYCDFTCSPDQSTFLSVSTTQKTTDGKQAVKSVEFAVSDEFKRGFYDSCKSVQFGATNGFAMDLIGGGAKNPEAFLKYMGDLRPGLGSPFQINFPSGIETGFSRRPLNCSDPEIFAKCACADCPTICPTLPYVAPPGSKTCHVGAVSCLTFSLLIIYSVAILCGLIFYTWKQAVQHRRRRYERVALLDPPHSPPVQGNGNGLDGLVGRGDDSESGPSGSIHFRLGRGASLLDPMDQLQPKQNKINAVLRRFFYRLGFFCAKRPLETFTIAALIVAALNIGWKDFTVETDPVRLWVAPNSESAREKHFFDEAFGPFYKDEQIFVTMVDGSSAVNHDTIEWWLGVERDIANLRTSDGVGLDDVCFAPAGTGTPCVIQSISAWTGDDLGQWGDEWRDRIKGCVAAPGECLPPFGQPIEAPFVLGSGEDDWMDSKALIATYVVNNYNDDRVKPVEAWERVLREHLSKVHRDGVRITYSTGVSLEEEINKSTNTDVKIVVLSYLVMFLYVSLTLGGGLPPSLVNTIWAWICYLPVLLHITSSDNHEPPPKFSLSVLPIFLSVNSKFSLGLFGIVIVLVAVSSSVGLFSLLGVRVTLIIAEVIPFLVLAVGVDNVFILVHELDRQNALHSQPDAPPPAENDDDSIQVNTTSIPAEERVARAVAKMGPSIALSSITETVAFALGALVPMPAVRNFAIYAAGSVFLGAVMQVTVFISAMSLDLKRAEAMRIDCFPCVRLRPPVGLYDDQPAAGERREGVVAKFFRRVYAPILLQREIKQLVLVLFGGLSLTAVIGIQHIKYGLDQRLALPSESYLVPYFNDLDKHFGVGPPVYFVAESAQVTDRHGQQQLCGKFTTCLELSVASSLEAERKRPDSSFIANPPASWIDDFLQWTNPAFTSCCRVRRRDPSIFCSPKESDRACRSCFEDQDWDSTMNGLPEGTDFMRYLQQWLISPTDSDCPLGGQAAYSTAVKLSQNGSAVAASHFRTFHTPVKTQDDYINALSAAQRISADITSRTGVHVFPYSIFYVFFDQYEHIASIAVQVLTLASIAIFAITSVLLGSWRTGAVVTAVCALAVLDVMGIMGFWHISLNAISLVNLVISLGIAVEFCSHVARAFMGAGGGVAWEKEGRREKDERAFTALADVGPSVFSGITLTKLIGISVLALTRSKLLEIYYFRMWLSLILSGALHGLVLLPVVLSYVGGPGYSLEDTDEEWVTSQMRRPMDYEYAPFADTDSVISEE